MDNKKILELERKKEQIIQELKRLREYSKLSVSNADKLIYPMVLAGEVEKRYIAPSKIGDIVRLILTPTKSEDKGLTKYKKFKDITKEEHRLVCSCVEECIEVIDKYNKIMHPHGINEGAKYKSDNDFFRER